MKSVHPGIVVILAALLLLPGLAFIALRLALPGDASYPVVDFQELNSGGLVVRPLSPDPHGLQSGDIVTAIQGRPVGEYVNRLFSPSPSIGSASRIEYTALRGGRTLQIAAPLAAFPLARLIRENWSIYLYILYLGLVSLVVFILRPRLPAAQLFLVVSSALFSSALVYFLGLEVDSLIYRWLVILFAWGAIALYGFLLSALVHLSLVFPKRHPILERNPGRALWIYLAVWIPMLLFLAPRWAAVASPAGRLALLVQGTTFMSVVFFPLLLVSTYSSYRAGTPREKRQMRWLMWGLVISLVPYLLVSVLPTLVGLPYKLPASLLGVLWCVIPTSFAIAVLRERIFDIDVIIRRTLIYSAVTVTLAAVYFISVILLQTVFQALTGQNQPPLATVLSTLMIAALFNPLRRRIQADIDRRFFRRKYDAQKSLESFAAKARQEVEIESLSDDLLSVVEGSVQPESITLWLLKH